MITSGNAFRRGRSASPFRKWVEGAKANYRHKQYVADSYLAALSGPASYEVEVESKLTIVPHPRLIGVIVKSGDHALRSSRDSSVASVMPADFHENQVAKKGWRAESHQAVKASIDPIREV